MPLLIQVSCLLHLYLCKFFCLLRNMWKQKRCTALPQASDIRQSMQWCICLFLELGLLHRKPPHNICITNIIMHGTGEGDWCISMCVIETKTLSYHCSQWILWNKGLLLGWNSYFLLLFCIIIIIIKNKTFKIYRLLIVTGD